MSLLSEYGIFLSLVSPTAHPDFTSCAFEDETANSISACVSEATFQATKWNEALNEHENYLYIVDNSQ